MSHIEAWILKPRLNRGLAFWLKPAASSTGAATWWGADRRRYNPVHAFNVHLARATALTR